MHPIHHDPGFEFPNFHNRGVNTCNLTIAANDDRSKLLVVFAQRNDEWKKGTSAINQAEAIIEKVASEVIPTLRRQHKIKKDCEIIWVVEVIVGPDNILNTTKILDVRFPKRTLMDRMIGRQSRMRLAMTFGRIVSPSEYPTLLQETR